MENAIGVFDSGLGGLTVLRLLQKSLPNENFIYYGDTARVPYGDRPREEIIQFSLEIANFLQAQQVKSLVIACNTIDSTAYSALASGVSLPVLGIIDSGVSLALATTRNKKIGLIATNGTIRSNSYQSRILAQGDYEVFSQAIPEFVEMVESGDRTNLDQVLDKNLRGLKEAGIDTLILGCTHFPVLAREIAEYLGPAIKLVDPAQELSRSICQKIKSSGENIGTTDYYISGPVEKFKNLAYNILNKKLENVHRLGL